MRITHASSTAQNHLKRLAVKHQKKIPMDLTPNPGWGWLELSKGERRLVFLPLSPSFILCSLNETPLEIKPTMDELSTDRN